MKNRWRKAWLWAAAWAAAGAGVCGATSAPLRPVLEPPPATQPGGPPTSGASTAPGTQAASRPATQAAGLEWLGSLEEAYGPAQRMRHPILVVVRAEWSVPSRQLETALGSATVGEKLRTWPRVRMDVDKDAAAARSLGVMRVPALRVVSAEGRVLAGREGVETAANLAAWLEEQERGAKGAILEELRPDKGVDEAAVPGLVAALGHADAGVREAAIRRLLPQGSVAAGAVARAAGTGPLAQKISALELLRAWRAPVAEMDPWRPETMTAERLRALEAWAAHPPESATQPAQLTAADRTAARADIVRLVEAENEPAARAIRERLARYGAALAGEVQDQLKEAATDQARERLLTLRYRLVADEGLVLGWPGGLEGLASMQAAARKAALEELTQRVTARDADLLLELFSHSDPLVRETALRLLQGVGGTAASGALVKLLADPEPNVRAAVLKQLTETPAASAVPAVLAYIQREKDADLIAHAARALRASHTPAAVKGLMKLLEHENWQIRAEAAEGLKESIGRSGTDEQRADYYAAMLRLLDDPDGYVVSRALAALEGVSVLPTLDPVVKTAGKHPELAAQVVRMVSESQQSGKYVSALREFASHKDPAVRAEAIPALCRVLKDAAAEEVRRGLRDGDGRVRLAAARQVGAQLETLHPWHTRSYGGSGESRPPASAEDWLAKLHGGKIPEAKWLAGLADDLEKMLAAPSPEERLAVALPLVALGRRERALPVAMEAAKANDGVFQASCAALEWLPWPERAKYFEYLRGLHSDADNMYWMVYHMTVVPDKRGSDALWSVLTAPQADLRTAVTVSGGLESLYRGGREYIYSSGALLTKTDLDALVARGRSGPQLQRLVALALLARLSPDKAGPLLAELQDDKATDEVLRGDIFHLRLTLPGEAEAVAVGGLQSASPRMRATAVRFLAFGTDSLRTLRDDFTISTTYYSSQVERGKPISPQPPQGVKPEPLKALLAGQEAEVTAGAGYLLALLRDGSGMEPLLKQWRADNNSRTRRLVYRAIAALNDENYLPTLDEIYQQLRKENDYELSEFYWTIRIMEGEKILAFRKTIRQEVGMERLR